MILKEIGAIESELMWFQVEKEDLACHNQRFLGNIQRHLPERAAYMASLLGGVNSSRQFYFTIDRKKIFLFSNKRVPYVCGLWCFAIIYGWLMVSGQLY